MTVDMPGTPKNIDDYLSRVAPAQRIALQTLRKQIRAIVPGAEECISYSMPAFREPGGPVFAGFLATKQGCSYFPFSGSTLDSIAAALSSYSRTKSGLHFDPEKGIPRPLLRKLIAARRAEISSQSAPKKVSKASVKTTVKKTNAKGSNRKAGARVTKRRR